MIIVDPDRHNMAQVPRDSPPSYDYAIDASNYPSDKPKPQIPSGINENEPLIPYNYDGSSRNTQPTFTPAPTVHYYTNPVTGERVTSFLPPSHPEMICLQAGEHVPETKYGILGILAAIFWFPVGIGLCLLDKRVRCSRCGLVIDEGICG